VANGATPDNPYNLTPNFILSIAEETTTTTNGKEDGDAIETKLRKPAGLSNAKVKSIIDLARHYERGDLSDHFLLGNDDGDRNNKTDDETIRTRLLQVKGLGPWSCDMFCYFIYIDQMCYH